MLFWQISVREQIMVKIRLWEPHEINHWIDINFKGWMGNSNPHKYIVCKIWNDMYSIDELLYYTENDW